MRYDNYLIYLEDMLEAMNKIERYIKDVDYEKFIQDEMMVDAVLNNVTIIGEAGTNIPEHVRGKYQEVPWKRIIGLRNIVVHKYFGVDLEIIWKIINENLPDTKPLIEKMLLQIRSQEKNNNE